MALSDSRPVLGPVALALADFAPLLCEHDIAVPHQQTNWTCGYANLQALLGTLARFRTESERAEPLAEDVLTLQRQIEAAWKEGFDPISAAQVAPSTCTCHALAYRERLISARAHLFFRIFFSPPPLPE